MVNVDIKTTSEIGSNVAFSEDPTTYVFYDVVVVKMPLEANGHLVHPCLVSVDS